MHKAFTQKYPGGTNKPLTEIIILDDNKNILKKGIALWDTGATISCISEKFAKEFGFEPYDFASISGVGGKEECGIYEVNILFPNNVGGSLRLSGIRHDVGCDILIGMDIINQGDFAISRTKTENYLSFRFPSRLEKVCFVSEENKSIGGGRNSPCPCGSGKKHKQCCGK